MLDVHSLTFYDIIMKINLLSKIVCRTPAFSITDTLPASLPALKPKIAESSPGFFDFIKAINPEDLPKLEERVWFTLWKYFNRAKYRSTPFGSFAAISVVPLKHKTATPIVLQRAVEAVHLIDWGDKDALSPVKERIQLDTLFINNSSCYWIGDEIRYIRIKNSVHELAAVKTIPVLLMLMEITKVKIACAEICSKLNSTFGIEQEHAIALLAQLLDLQLLTASILTNITGPDFFERIDFRKPESPTDYIIAKRALVCGSFEGTTLRNLPDLFSFFAKHLPQYANLDLENFKSNFIKRFEHQEVSLSTILDPEIGIGYGSAVQQFGSNELIEELKMAKPRRADTTIEYGELQVFLLRHMLRGETIQLEKFTGQGSETKNLLPNTFSVLFHLYQAMPVISTAGGCTANALLGRFTMKNEEVEEVAKEISGIEQAANTAIAFFDVAYQAEKKVDNVNRRQQLYPYELPILSWSTTSDPLTFDDILVAVHNNEVILRSKSRGIRLIPRIPSAYNYIRSDLSAFRFLCDLQHQGLQTQLSCRLRDFFPDLEYYPRVNYKDIIVSPATWLLPILIFNKFKNEDAQASALFRHWLEEKQINFTFKAGEADHTLSFDPNNAEDLLAFAIHCRQQPKNFYLVEALVDQQDMVTDETGKSYMPQYIASYQHGENIYPDAQPAPKPTANLERIHLPGGEWLYFEIYSHPAKSNSILLNRLALLKKKHQKLIKKWFFIRYSDPSPHLRWRLHLKNEEMSLAIIRDLKTIITTEVMTGSVIDVKIKTYVRETERYGAERMDLVESFFDADSNFVLFLLKKAKTEEQLIASSIKMIQKFVDLFIPEIDGQIHFAGDMGNRFASEMAIGPDHFKKLNASFNRIKHEINGLAIAPPVSMLNAYTEKIKKLLPTLTTDGHRYRLLADLIHMHINRVFTVDQRMYETIIYHYLKRYLQSKRAIGTLTSVQK